MTNPHSDVFYFDGNVDAVSEFVKNDPEGLQNIKLTKSSFGSIVWIRQGKQWRTLRVGQYIYRSRPGSYELYNVNPAKPELDEPLPFDEPQPVSTEDLSLDLQGVPPVGLLSTSESDLPKFDD